jgi:DNA-binding NarL/FixJ family response regulator
MSARVLLADDHRIFRDGLRPLMSRHEEFEVVAEAEDGLTALELCAEHKPDLAILDISMPGMNGIEVTCRLQRDFPDIRVIILSMHSDRRFVLEALKAGARGYALKDAGFDDLLKGARAVMAGQTFLSQEVSEQVIRDYVAVADGEPAGAFSVLSGREREVLQLLAEGQSTKEIAVRLNLSAKTVESHRKAVMDKLEIRSIAELTKYAIREGLTPLD